MKQLSTNVYVGGPNPKTMITPEHPKWFLLDDFEGEIWKDVVGFEGFYEVSNIGRVKSVKRVITKSNGSSTCFYPIILRFAQRFGYYRVCLHKIDIKKSFFVHRLVAKAFIQNPNNYNIINHKNEYPHDNRVENIEWCTQYYNLHYGNRYIKALSTLRENTGKPIEQHSLDGKLIKTYECISDAVKEGFSHSGILQCMTNKIRQFKGYLWVEVGTECKPLRDRKRDIKVYKYDLNNKLISIYPNIKDAEEKNNLKSRAIKAIRYGDRKSNIVNGYKYTFNPINV